jgi:predicted nucleic acid-binding protein
MSEVYHRIAEKNGYESALTCVSRIKAFNGTVMFRKDDAVAIDAAQLRLKSVRQQERGQRSNSISLADAYLIAISKREHAKIFTTDHELRDSAREADCIEKNVRFCPT